MKFRSFLCCELINGTTISAISKVMTDNDNSKNTHTDSKSKKKKLLPLWMFILFPSGLSLGFL